MTDCTSRRKFEGSVGDFVANPNRPGDAIFIAEAQDDITQSFAALVMLGLLGMLRLYAIEFTEKLLLLRHPSLRARYGNSRK